MRLAARKQLCHFRNWSRMALRIYAFARWRTCPPARPSSPPPMRSMRVQLLRLPCSPQISHSNVSSKLKACTKPVSVLLTALIQTLPGWKLLVKNWRKCTATSSKGWTSPLHRTRTRALPLVARSKRWGYPHSVQTEACSPVLFLPPACSKPNTGKLALMA